MFGDYVGTGIYIKTGYLYTSSNTGVYRYKLNDNEEILSTEQPEKILDGLVDKGRDNAKPFVLDDSGNIYITVGSYNDPCREKGTGKGISPCSILDSAGGIWKFRADKLNSYILIFTVFSLNWQYS
jgi:glucose/arabinose dehydrogenase